MPGIWGNLVVIFAGFVDDVNVPMAIFFISVVLFEGFWDKN